LKIGLTPLTDIAILQTNVPESTSFHSSVIAGKLINISIPAIMRSFDTIS